MNQEQAHEILVRNNALESNEFESKTDYVRMLKELNDYRKMYGIALLK
jgi:hypothetical protein